jgi:cytochrome c peroxidase
MTGRVRAWIGGATFLAAVFLAGAIVTRTAAGHDGPLNELAFSNPGGVLSTQTAAGGFDRDNPFFDDLGSNGRSCSSCHRPAQAWSVTPAELRERFEQTAGLDPVFRTNDGSACEGAAVATIEQRRQAFSPLLTKGLIRVGLAVPAGAEFEIVAVDDPYKCGAPLTSASLYRRPLPTTNLGFLNTVMWDGRGTVAGHAVNDDLVAQARDATVGHAQGSAPSSAQLRGIVAFELGLFTAQSRDRAAGSLAMAHRQSGPGGLARQPFCIGINDPLGMRPAMPGACLGASAFDPVVFTLFGAWQTAGTPERQSIARGEALFNTRRFAIDDVPGLNGGLQDPVSGPIAAGTCTVCHDTPNVGNHSVPMPLNIGIAAASRRTPDLPLYTLRHRTSGATVQTTDPGRAMVTGKWTDIGKFKGPILRALAARAPYFHDGSAASLADVVAFYDTRFNLRLTDRQKADLIAFLRAL